MSAFEKFVDYLRASKEEAKKVSWPSRQDTIRYSALVLGASIVVAVFFAGLDFGFTKLVDFMLLQRIGQKAPQSPPQIPIQPEVTVSSSAPITIPAPTPSVPPAQK